VAPVVSSGYAPGGARQTLPHVRYRPAEGGRSLSVIALAGRRLDAPGAPPRLPAGRTWLVREELRRLLRTRSATALVASAACGADLLALEAAESLGLRARIVLPFAVDVFRSKSVADRPGDWGRRYQRQIRRATRGRDLRILPAVEPDQRAFAEASGAILEEAQRLAGPLAVIAVVVWEGNSRGPDDLTAAFADLARARGLPVETVRP
jgi:hypothetical protein